MLSFAPVMLPAYSLNRTYALFFVAFSVIGGRSFRDGHSRLLLLSCISPLTCAAPRQEPTVS